MWDSKVQVISQTSASEIRFLFYQRDRSPNDRLSTKVRRIWRSDLVPDVRFVHYPVFGVLGSLFLYERGRRRVEDGGGEREEGGGGGKGGERERERERWGRRERQTDRDRQRGGGREREGGGGGQRDTLPQFINSFAVCFPSG